MKEKERENHPTLRLFIRAVVVPELKQGFGRVIRTETDTCVAAILDEQAATAGLLTLEELYKHSADLAKSLGATSLRSGSQVRDFCLHLVRQRNLAERKGFEPLRRY